MTEKSAAGFAREADWKAGPLPLRLHTPGHDRPLIADANRRATYLDEHVAAAVLGGEGVRRVHRVLSPAVVTTEGARIWAVEVVELSAVGAVGDRLMSAVRTGSARSASHGRFAVVLHASVDHRNRSLGGIVSGIRSIVPAALPTGLGIDQLQPSSWRGRPEVFRLVLATPEPPLPSLIPEPPIRSPTPSEGKRLDRHWAFVLASTTLPTHLGETSRAAFNFDEESLDAELDEGSYLALSGDWRVGVLRDGAAFVGLRNDQARADPLWNSGLDAWSETEFFDAAEHYLRTIYADVFLLGIMQRRALLRLRGAILAASGRSDSIWVARAVEAELALFRERFWWADVSRGGPGDRLLAAYHHQHALDQLFDQVDRDASSFATRVQLASDRGRAGALILIGLTSLCSLILAGARVLRPVPQHPEELLGAVCLVFLLVASTTLIFFRDLGRAVWESFRQTHPVKMISMRRRKRL